MDFVKDFVEKWKAVLMTPKPVFAAEKKNADYTEGVKQLAVAMVLAGILSAILVAVFPAKAPELPTGMNLPFPVQAPTASSVLLGLPVQIILGVIMLFVFTGILWVMAKILGGTGPYKEMVYLMALLSAAIALPNALNYVPVVGGLISFAVTIYSLYLLTLSIKEVHAMSTGKAVLVWLLPVFVLAILAFVIAAAFLATFLGGLGLAGSLPIK